MISTSPAVAEAVAVKSSGLALVWPSTQMLPLVELAVSVGVIQLQPIITAIGSTLIFNEQLTALQWSSGVVGVAGAIVMLRAGARLKKSQAVAAEAEGT